VTAQKQHQAVALVEPIVVLFARACERRPAGPGPHPHFVVAPDSVGMQGEFSPLARVRKELEGRWTLAYPRRLRRRKRRHPAIGNGVQEISPAELFQPAE
jgi:hypothetical protein